MRNKKLCCYDYYIHKNDKSSADIGFIHFFTRTYDHVDYIHNYVKSQLPVIIVFLIFTVNDSTAKLWYGLQIVFQRSDAARETALINRIFK